MLRLLYIAQVACIAAPLLQVWMLPKTHWFCCVSCLWVGPGRVQAPWLRSQAG